MRPSYDRPLTVLHVATINKPIGSEGGYGPIESVIYSIDQGLHRLGHRSIVACSSDSEVTGEHYPTVARSFGDYWRGGTPEGTAYVDLHLSRALTRAQRGDIDVIHMHEWFERVYEGSFNPPVPVVMTLHVPSVYSGVAEFRERSPHISPPPSLHFTAISEYQRRQYADLLPVTATIPHGVDVEDYSFAQAPYSGQYLLNIGRITEVKGQDIAIEAAKRSGARLIIAGCVQNKSEDRAFFEGLKPAFDLIADVGQSVATPHYYDTVMKPILSSTKQIIYVGELGAAAKKHWYQHARATLFPVRWGEPFGMVMIESMAAGTPVLAFGEGAVPEIVRHGETGFVVDSVEAMVRAVGYIDSIDRGECRQHVDANFSVRRMANRYAALYEQLAVRRAPPADRGTAQVALS